ncbi:MAG: OB-fold domain-containing protein [Sphingorhabdus sp.]
MGPEAEYRAHLAAGRFMIQRGATSGKAFFPPRTHEPVTGDAAKWVEASGCGTVYTVTIVRKRDPEPDYNIVLIDLQEGPRLMSRMDGIAPGEVKIGMAVTARIITENETPVLIFEPAA